MLCNHLLFVIYHIHVQYVHINQMYVAVFLGTYLIAGVNSDESITQCKGGYGMHIHVKYVYMCGRGD
ncbi:hypothetical protein EON63_19355 [archaeon]|nr:MAG: hypothetical protein EON63_19355 [archaeon]